MTEAGISTCRAVCERERPYTQKQQQGYCYIQPRIGRHERERLKFIWEHETYSSVACLLGVGGGWWVEAKR